MIQVALSRTPGVFWPRIAEIEAHKPTTRFDTPIPADFAVGGISKQLARLVKTTNQSMDYCLSF